MQRGAIPYSHTVHFTATKRNMISREVKILRKSSV